jgi:hypothetical protein
MRTLLRALLVAGLVVVAAVVVAAVALSYVPYPNATLTIDGETLSLSGLDGWQAAAVLAAGAMALVGFVIASALGILAGVVVAVLAALLAVAAVAVVALLLASPLLLVGWLLWRALRRSRSPPSSAAAVDLVSTPAPAQAAS